MIVRKKKESKICGFLFVCYFSILISDTMAAQTLQLVAAKCPTDELSYTNCAIISEKDIDPKRIR
jgi:hypothetical protein